MTIALKFLSLQCWKTDRYRANCTIRDEIRIGFYCSAADDDVDDNNKIIIHISPRGIF